MSDKKETLKKIAIFGGIILLSAIAMIYNNWLTTLPQDYTVGEVIDVYKPAKGNTRAEFRYFVKNQEYKQSVNNYGYEKVARIGKRFLVEYPEDHTGSGVILLDHPVPDGIEAPPGGWDEMPVFKKK